MASRRLAVISRHLVDSGSISDATPSFFAHEPCAGEAPKLTIKMHPEVRRALATGGPVVALESTIISHGMPYPQNFETAKKVESVVRENGAVPATIAILDGVICVGLEESQLRQLATLGKSVVKCSRRDLAVVVARGQCGATTVSATMLIAHMVGIRIFVTGGVGGVHRHGETSMDVSADLTELGRTPVAVVCAGAKSILDIPRTLEFLETQGVTVAGYGTNEFPAFFTPHSGCKASCRLDTPEECARMIQSNHAMGLNSGMLVAVPIPAEHAAEGQTIDAAIQKALRECESQQQMEGKEVTPFLLSRINEITGGASLKANIALVLNNAKVGAQIAKSLSTIQRPSSPMSQQPGGGRGVQSKPKSVFKDTTRKSPLKSNRVVIVGGCVVDLVAAPFQPFRMHTSNPGKVTLSFGGVARNISEVLQRLEDRPILITAVGEDEYGSLLRDHLNAIGMVDSVVKVCAGVRSAVYSAALDGSGDLLSAVADMSIFNEISPEFIRSQESLLSQAPLIVFDANISKETMAEICRIASKHNVPVWFEPTSVAKSVRAVEAGCLPYITYTSPNLEELNNMTQNFDAPREQNIEKLLRSGVKHVLHTMGPEGVLVATVASSSRFAPSAPSVTRLRPLPVKQVVNTTGAGDNMVAGTVHGLLAGLPIQEAVKIGLRCSQLCIQSEEAVSPDLSLEAL